MLVRAVTGAIYVTVIVLSCFYGGFALTGLLCLLIPLLILELGLMFDQSEYTPNVLMMVFIGTLFALCNFIVLSLDFSAFSLISMSIMFALVILIPVVVGIGEIIRKKKHPFINFAIATSGIFYITFPLLFVLNMSGPFTQNYSPERLLSVFILIWCADTFAYLVGKKFGKNKLAPTISPNKTWEGLIGGLFFTIAAALGMVYFFEVLPWSHAIIIAIMVVIFGLFGDLFQSMIKRSLGLKDSGKILPGHGGLLDRLDSALFVLPVVYLFFYFYEAFS